MNSTIRTLKEQAPGVNIQLRMITRTPFAELVKAGKVDIAFMQSLSTEEPDVPHAHIAHIEMHAALPIGHPCAHQPTIKIRDLDDDSILWFDPIIAPSLTRRLEERFAELNSKATFQYLTVSENARIHLTSVGLGIALVSSTLVNYLKDTAVVRPISDLDVQGDLYAAWRERNTNPAFRLLEPIIEELQQGNC